MHPAYKGQVFSKYFLRSLLICGTLILQTGQKSPNLRTDFFFLQIKMRNRTQLLLKCRPEKNTNLRNIFWSVCKLVQKYNWGPEICILQFFLYNLKSFFISPENVRNKNVNLFISCLLIVSVFLDFVTKCQVLKMLILKC